MITRSKMRQASKEETCLKELLFKMVPIWSLSDDLLSKIFSYLNANDRFRLTEVCTRWAGVSRTDWIDVTCLDLSSIPGENIGPIIRLCPKLVSITAQNRRTLDLNSITQNLRTELTTLSFYRVFTRLAELPESLKRLRLSVDFLCDQAKTAAVPWSTLDCLILEIPEFNPTFSLFLAYLMLLDSCNDEMPVIFRLRQLRELRLVHLPDNDFVLADEAAVASVVSELNRLEVLCFDFSFNHAVDFSVLAPLFTCHPTLRILIITGIFSPTGSPDPWLLGQPYWDSGDSPSPPSTASGKSANGVASQKSLELGSANHSATNEELLLNASGALSNGVGTPSKTCSSAVSIGSDLGESSEDEEDEAALIPTRRRYPNGFGADPLPLLHVFIGGTIAQKICFATPLDAMEVHPINLPMPAFLEQQEIAEIFEGSWIGEMIKKSAKSNTPLWDYDERTAQSFLSL